MIKRIVKLTFEPALVDDFMLVFENSKVAIRGFEGCRHMELLRHQEQPNVMFTLSIWDDATALDRYRNSALFKETWQKTKALFSAKPEAWSVDVVDAP